MATMTTETDVAQIVEEMVRQSKEASAVFTQYSQEDVDRIVYAAARAGAHHRIELARMAVEETGMGVFEDKVIKNLFATENVYHDIRDIKTVGLIHDCAETGIMEFAEPLGVILAITPVTNPTSTCMFKILLALKTRNTIIISPARNAMKCTNEAARILYEAALEAGAPDYCVRWVENPSREVTHALMSHPDVAVVLATGGTGLVHAAYGSGKPAIGVGPGNVPVFIEKTADLDQAINDIVLSKTFDNGMICASEQSLIVEASIKDKVEEKLRAMGAYFLSREETEKLQNIVIDPQKMTMNPKVVGQKAAHIAEMAGIKVPQDTRLLIAPLDGVGDGYPLSREKLCPLLGFYTVQSLDEGVNLCTDLTHLGGLGHTASIFSKDPEAIREFGETINAGRVIVNAPSSHGGIGDIYNCLHPSLTLGCGAGGRNITTDNVTVTHLLNIKRISKRMAKMRWFRVPSRIYFEPHSMDMFLKQEAKELGCHRAFIVCTGSGIRQGAVGRLEQGLLEAGITSTIFSDIAPDPTLEMIEAGYRAMERAKPDLIVAIGGGSPLDAAKAMWFFYEQPDFSFNDLKLYFMDIRKRIVKFPSLGRKAKLIAIPTTSGTGSEVTAFTVVTDSTTHKKYPIADYSLTPDIAIIDPTLVMTVPAETTADTGLDALSHALECYVSIIASDFTDPLALKAIQLIFKYLPDAMKNGKDARAREKLHNASTIAGMAFANAFLGINHSLAHILGATFHISHGRANAFVMIPVLRYNAEKPHKLQAYPNYESPKSKERYGEIAHALNLSFKTPEEGVESLVNAIKELKKQVGIPASLKEAGIAKADFDKQIDRMAELAFEDQCTVSNPSYPLVEDLKQMLRDTYDGV
ncbi:MAG: bifunctional acetaldehyde-CoA/alcohol dehydrogenase [Candidatus Eremiobacteraeota bacterium]|nr:bifunctional acetaldehyde-CoA/alcohol dehydrogenase [Candidatus Eremiobacteraeota bacterium]